jgi:hypothetical protein
MALTVDGGAPKAAKPAPAPEPAASKAPAPAAKPAETPAAAPQAPAQSDTYKAPAAKKEELVDLAAVRRPMGEEIPTATGTAGGEVGISAADFPSTEGTGGTDGAKDPKINVDGAAGATYQRVNGTPFIQGAGDGADVHWNDIDQGGLGDCYFMSAMGSVAQQDPDVIRNAIRDNGDGTYTVRFYERQGNGPLGIGGLFGSYSYNPVEIRVTPDFPMRDGQPVFAGMPDSNGAQRELWPALMEKAYAQYSGSYGAIEGGNPARAMELLTGRPSEEYSASSMTIDQLANLHRDGHALTASSLRSGDGKTAYADGTLVSRHAYMITGVDRDAGTVTLRNPWGPDQPNITMSIADFNRNFRAVQSNPGQ